MGLFDNLFKKPKMTVTIDKRIKFDSGESLERKPCPKKPKLTLDEQWKNITKQSQEHMKNGRIGLYACDLYSFSEIDRKEKRYNDQIKKLMISAYIHLSEAESISAFHQYGKDVGIPAPTLPPAVIRATNTAIKRLNWSMQDYRDAFMNTIETTMVPVHLFSTKDCLDIICLYLDGSSDKAERKIRSEVKKYVSTHRK